MPEWWSWGSFVVGMIVMAVIGGGWVIVADSDWFN